MDFDIELSDEGLLTITPPESYETDREFMVEFIDSLFWEDMNYYHSSYDGWQYVVSMNHQLVFPLDDYGYDLMRDMRDGKKVEVMGRPMDDYKEYEWHDAIQM